MDILSVDLSKKHKSFTSFIISIIQNLDKMKPEEIIELIKSSKENGVNVSQDYLDKVVAKIDELKNNKKWMLKYIADIALKGSELGVITSNEAMKKIAELSDCSIDELIISHVVHETTLKEKVSSNESGLVRNIKDTWEKANEDYTIFIKRIAPFLARYLPSNSKPVEIQKMREAIDDATDKKIKLVLRNNVWTIAPKTPEPVTV
jgi:hypothetical protein